MFLNHPLLSIDINDNYIKVLEFSGFVLKRIVNIGKIKLPNEAIVEGKIEDPKKVVLNLRKIIKKLNISINKRVSLGVDINNTMTRIVELKSKKKSEIETEVQNIAEDVLEKDPNDITFDYYLYKEKSEKGQFRVLIMGAEKESIFKKIDLIKKARLQVGLIDINSIALYNMVYYNYSFNKELEVILNIEYTSSQIIFVSNKEYCGEAKISFGEKNYITNVIEHLNIQDEKTKEIIQSSLKYKNTLYKKYQTIIISTHTLFVAEIESAIEIFIKSKNNYNKHKVVTMFYLTGDGCNSKTFVKAIMHKFKAKASIVDPLHKYSIPRNKEQLVQTDKNSFSIASGLANRTFSYVK